MSNSISFSTYFPLVRPSTHLYHYYHHHHHHPHPHQYHPHAHPHAHPHPYPYPHEPNLGVTDTAHAAAPRKRVRVNFTAATTASVSASASASASTPQPSPPPPPPSSSSPSPSDMSVEDALTGGDVGRVAALVVRDMGSLAAPVVERAIQVLVDANEWRGVLDIFEQSMEHSALRHELSARAYNNIFLASLRVGSRAACKHAYSLFLRLDNGEGMEHLRPKAFNFLFVGLCKSQLVDEAKVVLEKCQEYGYYLNRYSYNAFLNACAKTNRVTDAFFAFKAMAESNITPDVVSCNVLISCCVRAEEIDVALSVLHRMPSWGIAPDIYSFNSVINGYRKARMLEQAFDLVASMELAAGIEPIEGRNPSLTFAPPRDVSSDNQPSGPTPSQNCDDEQRQSTSASSNGKNKSNDRQSQNRARGGRDDRADPNNDTATCGQSADERTSVALGCVKPDLVTYNTLISGIAAANEPDLARAQAVKAHMRRLGIEGNEVTYNALMATATRSGRVDEAFEIYDEMLKYDSSTLNVELFTTLISLCGQAGQMERAFKVHEEMIKNGINPSVVTFNALLTACQRGHRDDAADIALDVLKIMRETPGCMPDVITYSTLIDTLGRDGRFDEMRRLMQRMKADGLSPNFVTYTSIISALCKFGQLSEALDLMAEMEHQGIEPNVYTFSCLVSGARRLKDMSRALDIVNMMKERGVALNNVTYALLLQMSARTGQRRWVERVLAEMQGDPRLVRSGRLDEVRRLIGNDEVLEYRQKSKRASQILAQAFNIIASMLGEKHKGIKI